MSRRLLVGTGWKMNLTASETRHYASRLREQLSGVAHDDIETFLPAWRRLARSGRREGRLAPLLHPP